MQREDLVDRDAFATVAEEQSFTRAAAKLGRNVAVGPARLRDGDQIADELAAAFGVVVDALRYRGWRADLRCK